MVGNPLELFAASPGGCTEARVLAHEFTTDFLVDLIRARLATVQTECAVAGGRSMQVARMRITDAGRRALAELRWPLILKRASQAAYPARGTMTINYDRSPTHDYEPTVELATDAA